MRAARKECSKLPGQLSLVFSLAGGDVEILEVDSVFLPV